MIHAGCFILFSVNRILLLFAFLSLSNIVLSQNFLIEGKLIDETTGESLAGATIYIDGTSNGVTTDINGNYSLRVSKSQSENFNVIIQFLGYKNDTIAVKKSQLPLNLNVKLSQSAESLNTVQITGRFEGQQKALYEQRNAPNIKNIISAEQIKLFPDNNAAEAIQRLPGITLQRDQGEGRFVQLRGTPPELTNFNINGEQIPSPEGDVRFVGMDVISSDQIESIEITKALTPDMDADGIGGNVNIVTKTARDSVPDVRAMVAGGYNDITEAGNFQSQFSYGQRYGKFGFMVNGNYYRNNQGAHNMEFKFVKRPTQENEVFDAVYSDIQLRDYRIVRERIGTTTSLDYEFSNRSKIYLKAITNRFSDDEIRRRVRNKFGSGTIINDHTSREASIERELKMRTKIQTINTINLGGEHDLRFMNISYMSSYSFAKEEIPDFFEMSFDSDELNMNLDLSEKNYPIVDYPTDIDRQTAYDYGDYTFNELTEGSSIARDENIAYKLNLAFPYFIGDTKGEFKVGTRIRNKSKERDKSALVYDNYYEIFLPGQRQIYLQEGPELSLRTIAGGYNEEKLLDRDIELGLTPGPIESTDFFQFYRQNFKLAEADTKNEEFAEDYTAKEDIYAYYAMFTHHIRKWMFLAGVRYERTDVTYNGNEIVLYKGRFFESLKEREAVNKYEFILPQFHTRYKFNERTNLRFAATYTYSRPNFEDILPYRQETDIDEVRFGNSELKFPLALNLDLLAETYIKNNGLISGGVFFKQIDNFIFYYKRFVHLDSNFSTAGLTEVTIATNGESAKVAGAEINLNYKLTFLPSFLGNFGIYSNYTYTWSEARIQERQTVDKLDEVFIYQGNGNSFVSTTGDIETIPLPGQAKHSVNFAVFYDTKNFYAKISANYNSAFLTELGQEKDFDIYNDESLHIDFTSDYRITKNMRVFMQVLNIANTPLRFYMGRPDRVKQHEYYSWTSRIGMRFSF